MSSGSGTQGAPTLEAVAASAGVSRATASRVLRGASNVSERARTAVLAAADALSYTPNRAARALVTGHSDSVVFLVDETEDRLFADPFFLGTLRGSQTQIASAGFQLVFTVTSSAEDHQRFLHFATSGHVDGVLLASLHGQDKLPQELESLGVPTVLLGRPLSGSANLYYVDADNVGGAATATSYLIDSGRTTVATVTGPQDMCAGQDRLTGYRDALQKANLPEQDDLVGEGGFTLSSGFDAMTQLLETRPDIDAVFAASDLTALGAMRAIELSGRRIHDDVAVVGFDDIPDARQARPALTTIRQPLAELGQTLSRLLLRRVYGEHPPQASVLPVQLIERETA
ncbi:MAG: LacI family DNA-binding transcriptional regulator [Nocardioidaceae bacterium]